MDERLAPDVEEALKVLSRNGIPRGLANKALKLAEERGCLTVFSVVDALTRVAGRMEFAGARTEADEKASSLLALVA